MAATMPIWVAATGLYRAVNSDPTGIRPAVFRQKGPTQAGGTVHLTHASAAEQSDDAIASGDQCSGEESALVDGGRVADPRRGGGGDRLVGLRQLRSTLRAGARRRRQAYRQTRKGSWGSVAPHRSIIAQSSVAHALLRAPRWQSCRRSAGRTKTSVARSRDTARKSACATVELSSFRTCPGSGSGCRTAGKARSPSSARWRARKTWTARATRDLVRRKGTRCCWRYYARASQTYFRIPGTCIQRLAW